ADCLGQAFLACVDLLAYSGLEPVVPGRFDQQPACVAVARLGDAAPARALAAGVLRGHETQVAHELARVFEAVEVADLRNQADRGDSGYAAQRLQGADHRLEAPARD